MQKCVNDTDGDGDCHLCFRRGGCVSIGGPFLRKDMERDIEDRFAYCLRNSAIVRAAYQEGVGTGLTTEEWLKLAIVALVSAYDGFISASVNLSGD